MLLADTLSGTYKLVLVLHILAAIIGFGAVMLNALYAAQARGRRGAEGLAISQANFLVSSVAQYFIYAVFVLGILLVLLSDDAWGFDQFWIWGSMGLYVIGLSLSHGVLQPNVRRLIALQEQMVHGGSPPAGAAGGGLPPQLAEMEQRGKRVGMTAAALDVVLVLILFLMVWKPGLN